MSNKTFSPCSSASPDGPGQDKEASMPLNLDILKSLSEKKTTRDGNPPKRRGPKPDSKPALTRRQELNRQAQRTHRERKELYIKALEEEVLRLKEIYTTATQNTDRLASENKHLREALTHNGIGIPFNALNLADDATSNPSGSASFSAYSHATSPQNAYMPAMSSHSTAPSVSSPPQTGKGIDVEQAGIDFVLTDSSSLEKPCMAHMPFLLDRAAESGGEPCGHALMATCPPQPFQKLTPQIPFGHTQVKAEENGGHQTWELSKTGLAVLLDLSKRLNLDGEITPVMAWRMIMEHVKFLDLHENDLLRLAEELGRKVRCYGFGAVMEEFEVRDALEGVLTA